MKLNINGTHCSETTSEMRVLSFKLSFCFEGFLFYSVTLPPTALPQNPPSPAFWYLLQVTIRRVPCYSH